MTGRKMDLAAALRVMVVIGALAGALVAVPGTAAAGQGRHDRDGDGLRNRWEVKVAQTDPRDADTDDDGMTDGMENPDRDGLRNVGEQRHGADPYDRDSDDDTLPDGYEVHHSQTDPDDDDSDDDGLTDDEDDSDCDGSSNGEEHDDGTDPDDDEDHDEDESDDEAEDDESCLAPAALRPANG